MTRMPGRMNCRYVARRPGDRPAEHVREHQREQHRRHRHVDQLLGNVLDLQHRRASRTSARRRSGAGARRPRARGERLAQRDVGARLEAGSGSCVDAHAASVFVSSAGVAGQREEHLVEARLPEREVGDADAGARRAPRRPAPPGRRPRTTADSAAGSASRWTAPSSRASTRSASRPLVGVEQAHVQRARADRCLQLGRRALGDRPGRDRSPRCRRRAGRPRRGTACTTGSSCRRRRARG